MPIFRANNRVYYFSHIPKCGGTTVEDLIRTISGDDLAMLNRRLYRQGGAPWSASSPQHIPGDILSNYFPVTFFDGFFAVTRNPVDRFVSAFHFQKSFVGSIPADTDINNFVSSWEDRRILIPGNFDNHFLPQVRFLYPDAPYTLFTLEEGMERVRDHVCSLFQADAESVTIPHALKRPRGTDDGTNPLTEESRRTIERLYEIDYSTLGL